MRPHDGSQPADFRLVLFTASEEELKDPYPCPWNSGSAKPTKKNQDHACSLQPTKKHPKEAFLDRTRGHQLRANEEAPVAIIDRPETGPLDDEEGASMLLPTKSGLKSQLLLWVTTLKLFENTQGDLLPKCCCWLLVVGCWLLFVVCCLLFVVCCLLFVVCCLLFVVCCLLFVVCCLLFVVCCLLFWFRRTRVDVSPKLAFTPTSPCGAHLFQPLTILSIS